MEPPSTMTMDNTDAKIGRSMKNLENNLPPHCHVKDLRRDPGVHSDEPEA
jgi:hypothetical protein